MMKRNAHAKINLTLKILGRRLDGFHELETVMCPLALHDTITLEKRAEECSLEVLGADLPTGPENLAMKAALMLKERAGYRGGVHVKLEKRIPHGGGLAGGSSDAATVLMGCNDLWEIGLSQVELGEVASRLGSDVNFFLQPQPAICRGRGEIVEPVKIRESPWVLLINPGWGVSTPWAYQTYAAKPMKGEVGRWRFGMKRGAGVYEEVELVNDLEPAVFSKYLWIAAAKEWLRGEDGVLDAMMSGSGATVFALVEEEAVGKRLEEAARVHLGGSITTALSRLGNGAEVE